MGAVRVERLDHFSEIALSVCQQEGIDLHFNCNPTGAGAAECSTGYVAPAFCGTGGDGQA